MPSFIDREKSVAYNILSTALNRTNESNFVAFVGEDHLMSVTKEIMNFINKGE